MPGNMLSGEDTLKIKPTSQETRCLLEGGKNSDSFKKQVL